MTLSGAVGHSTALDGREAGASAMQQALEILGRAPASFAWVIASHSHSIQQVLSGVAEKVGDIPILGMSTSGELTTEGLSRRSVVVALLSGEDLNGRSNWWANFSQDSRSCVQNMLQTLRPDGEEGEILLTVADGLGGDPALLSSSLSTGGYAVAGCLAGGDLWRGRTYQIGGRQSGSGGLGAAVLSGDVAIGCGAAHGWRPVGAVARLTHVQGQWVRSIDNQPASELYARLFGYPARSWSKPPLNDLVRVYPLGLMEDDRLAVYSPLRIEADGSLRMNAALPEGQVVELMVGAYQDCLISAAQAAQQALEALGPTRPRLALVLVDNAWQTILVDKPGAEIQAVRDVIGADVPVAGGYTFGQIVRPDRSQPARLLNQHILVVLFGSRKIEGEASG